MCLFSLKSPCSSTVLFVSDYFGWLLIWFLFDLSKYPCEPRVGMEKKRDSVLIFAPNTDKKTSKTKRTLSVAVWTSPVSLIPPRRVHSRAESDTAEVMTLCEIKSHQWRIFPTHRVSSPVQACHAQLFAMSSDERGVNEFPLSVYYWCPGTEEDVSIFHQSM